MGVLRVEGEPGEESRGPEFAAGTFIDGRAIYFMIIADDATIL